MNKTAPGSREQLGNVFDMAAYRTGEDPAVAVESLPVDEVAHVLPAPSVLTEADNGQLLVNWQIARNEFARVSAERSSRTFSFGRGSEFNEEALETAKDTYELHRNRLMGYQSLKAFAAGAKGEELEKKEAEIADEHASSLAEALFAERRIATTLYARKTEQNGNPILTHQDKTSIPERQRSKNQLGHFVRKAYWWWGKQNDGTIQGKINRAGATVALGLPFGVVGVALAPLAAGAIGAAGAATAVAAMTRVSKSAMVFHLDKRGRGRRYIDGLQHEIDTAIQQGKAESVADRVVAQTKERVKDNRKQAGLAVISVLGGTALGEAVRLLHLLPSGGSRSPGVLRGRPSAQPKSSGQSLLTRNPPYPLETAAKQPSTSAAAHQIHINAKQIKDSAVSTVFERAEGLHKGFTDMTLAARRAIKHGLLTRFQPDPSNPNLFRYEVTNKGAKEFAKGAAGSDRTVNVMRVLSHFGRVSILRR